MQGRATLLLRPFNKTCKKKTWHLPCAAASPTVGKTPASLRGFGSRSWKDAEVGEFAEKTATGFGKNPERWSLNHQSWVLCIFIYIHMRSIYKCIHMCMCMCIYIYTEATLNKTALFWSFCRCQRQTWRFCCLGEFLSWFHQTNFLKQGHYLRFSLLQ